MIVNEGKKGKRHQKFNAKEPREQKNKYELTGSHSSFIRTQILMNEEK